MFGDMFQSPKTGLCYFHSSRVEKMKIALEVSIP